MKKLRDEINVFFTSCFYSIMSAEERNLEAITNGTLTLKEIHLLEAVFKCVETGDNNFSAVAKRLGVTLGTLTTSFNKLEKKGYLKKTRDEKDRRVFYIEPTELASFINDEHEKFHKKMVDDIVSVLTEDEQEHLASALKQLDAFFAKV